ncbi:MAG TPA: NTP transferase domain-containing protein [Steroidobacteraceae bacterium]|jgi:CTP:molybdopterin cytidylyltransferase MocA|nr:NTP transferase domain-containing protein [Steroidobacteraceae bacterium]
MIATIATAGPSPRIIVLSAGFSARLGKPKALARIGGMTLLQRTVRTVAPLTTAKVIIVLAPRAARARAELRRERVEIIESRHRARGLSASVRCGLRRAGYSAAVLLLPVDLPCLERRELRRLIIRWRSARRAVVARRLGQRAATPVIVPRRLYLQALKITGDFGLKELVNGPGGARKLLDVPSAALDVDTPEDLRRARRRRLGRR